jgi:hypothetical protein
MVPPGACVYSRSIDFHGSRSAEPRFRIRSDAQSASVRRRRFSLRRKEEVAVKTASLAGIVLIVLGALALIYQGFSYTKRERVVDVGPIHATKDTHKTVPIPPVLGGIAVVGGIVLLVVGAKQK